MITAAGYVRVSKEEQAEKDLSIPAQKSRIVSYCQSQGWELSEFYIDDGYSAKSLDRPAMQRLMKDSRSGKFQAVVVVKLDRLSRNQKDVLYVLEDVFEPHGVGFKSVTQPFDTTTAFGKANLGMLAVFAQLERDQLIERVVDAKQEAARQGRFMGGPPPFGYRHNPATKSVEIDDLKADIVRTIYAEYLKGDKGYQAVAEFLTEQKILASKGKAWNRCSVLKILTNPFYAGFLPHKDELYKGRQPAIITPEEWTGVQELLKSRNKYLPIIHAGLVSGLIFCGECGARMRTKNVWQNYPSIDPKRVIRYYICYSQDGSTPYMVKDPECRCGYKQTETIDNYVVDQLMQYSVNPKLARQAVKEMLDGSNDTHSLKLLVQAKKELAGIKKKIDRWYDAFEKGALNPDDLTERVRDLRERKYQLEQQVINHEAALEKEQSRAQSAEELLSTLKQFNMLWRAATEEERKSIVRNLVKAVRVYKNDRIEVDFF